MSRLRSLALRATTRLRHEVARLVLPTPQVDRIKNQVVVVTDWGDDDAIANLELQGRLLDVDVTKVQGVPVLASPLFGAIILDRFLDTIKITLALRIQHWENQGLSTEQINLQLPRFSLVNVFDRSVGSERIPGIVEGDFAIGKYSVKVGLVGPLENGIIGYLSRRLSNMRAFELSNQDYQVDNLGCVTWDGRTRFLPAGAFFANGVAASEFGNSVDLSIYPSISLNSGNEASLVVPVVGIDSIGNVVFGIGNGEAETRVLHLPSVEFRPTNGHGRQFGARSGRTISDVAQGETVIYPGSNGLLEGAVNLGNLASIIGLRPEHLDVVRDGPKLRPVTTFELEAA